jgi:hypothetical protein
VIDVKELLDANASGPIEVTESGIIVFPIPKSNVLVAVSIIALQLSLES